MRFFFSVLPDAAGLRSEGWYKEIVRNKMRRNPQMKPNWRDRNWKMPPSSANRTCRHPNIATFVILAFVFGLRLQTCSLVSLRWKLKAVKNRATPHKRLWVQKKKNNTICEPGVWSNVKNVHCGRDRHSCPPLLLSVFFLVYLPNVSYLLPTRSFCPY